MKTIVKKEYIAPVVCEVEVSEIFVLSGTIITEGDGDDYADWGDDGFTDQKSNSNIGSWENIWNE